MESIAQQGGIKDGEGEDADHVLITTLITTKPPTFKPKRKQHLTKWDIFERKIAEYLRERENYKTSQGTLAEASKINRLFA